MPSSRSLIIVCNMRLQSLRGRGVFHEVPNFYGMLIAVCKIQRSDTGFVQTGGDHNGQPPRCS